MNRREVCKILASIPFFGIKPRNDLYEYVPSDYKIIEYHFNSRKWVSFKEKEIDYNEWFIGAPMHNSPLTKIDLLKLVKISKKNNEKFIHMLFHNNIPYQYISCSNELELTDVSKQYLERKICVQN